ncbi:MAG: hypothetical protein SFY68_06315 [Candidatus Sumerlaeia bacterium]|nr:hypothetical protein [Candidatus Sumerlaeia bacterium]
MIFLSVLALAFVAVAHLGYARGVDSSRSRMFNTERQLQELADYLSLMTVEEVSQNIKPSEQTDIFFINILQKNHPDFHWYQIRENPTHQTFLTHRSFIYHAVGKKFLIISPGPDNDFEDHPSKWFTAETTMQSPEILSRKPKSSGFFSADDGDLYVIGEHQ